jgi:thiol-disulfide isomerase/thioredoxin
MLAACDNTTTAGQRSDAKLAKDFSLAGLSGEPVRLSRSVQQSPQLVLFWATWCPYCRALMPHLQSIVMEHEGRIGVLAVNIREDGDPAAYLEENGFDFTLLLEGDEVGEKYGVKGTPSLYLVDSDMRVFFDLNQVPRLALESDGEKMSHRRMAQQLAPYWAAELRKAIATLP